MIVEVVSVGTELLLGQIINTNASDIAACLADEGFDANYQVTVGDNFDRLRSVIEVAVGRADAVVITGGIGPTRDDLTKEALCAVTDRKMARDEAYAEAIRQRVLATRGEVAPSALQMADYPQGTTPLPNRNGVALGVFVRINGTPTFAVPGVPREMSVMVDEQVLPRLRSANDAPTVLSSRVVRTWGKGETQVAELLDDLFASTNPSIAFLINETEVGVRISAKADDEATARSMIEPVEHTVRERLADDVFGFDEQTCVDALAIGLGERHWSIAVNDAATAGLTASRLAVHDSNCFAGGRILTAAETRTALDLARAAVQETGAAVGVGIGPLQERTDPSGAAGLTLGVHTPDGEGSRTIHVMGDLELARAHAANTVLHLTRMAALGNWWTNQA